MRGGTVLETVRSPPAPDQIHFVPASALRLHFAVLRLSENQFVLLWLVDQNPTSSDARIDKKETTPIPIAKFATAVFFRTERFEGFSAGKRNRTASTVLFLVAAGKG